MCWCWTRPTRWDLLHQGITRFELAKQQALDVVRHSADGDAFSLVWMGLPSRSVISRPTYDRNAVAEEIQRMTCGQGGADLEQTLQLVEQLVRQGREERPPLELCQVDWFTDLRRNTWESAKSGRIATRAGQLSARAQLVVVDLGAPVDVNLVVTDLRTATSYVTVGQEVSFQAMIENLGTEPVVDTPMELLVEGRAVARRTLQLAPQGTQIVTIPHRFLSEADHRVEVRLPQDSLPLDSQRFLALPVRATTRVLCVGGRDRSARYMALALQPDPAVAQPVATTRISATALRDVDLVPYDAVFLCNVDNLTEADASQLRDHLARGGGLVVFVGEHVQAAHYNRLLVDVSPERRVLPARLIGTSERGEYHFDPRGYEHPIVAPFQGHEQTGLLTTPIWRYERLEKRPEADVALWFDNGDPAMIEESRARGRCLLVATPAADAAAGTASGIASGTATDASSHDAAAWNAWAVWPSFPPLMFELLGRAVNRRYEGRNVPVGGQFVGAMGSEPVGNSVVIEREADREMFRLPWPQSTQAWSFSETWLSGFYTARVGQSEERELYAANLDTSESNPESIAPADLGDAFQVRTMEELKLQDNVSPTSAERPLFRWLLGILLAFVLTESWLTWQTSSPLSQGREGGVKTE